MENHEHLRQFDIPFVGLQEGQHVYTYTIDTAFLQAFPDRLIQHGDVYLHLTLDKQKEHFFVLTFFIDGTIDTECDRCLNDLTLQVHATHRVVVKFEDRASQKDQGDPDVMVLSLKATTLNIAQQLFELLHMQLPMRKTCEMDALEEKQCNPKVVEKLNKLSPGEDPEIDPRWEQLRKLGSNH